MSSLIPDNVSKHTNVYDVLVERGLVAQCTNPEKFRELLGNEKIKFSTSDSTRQQTASTSDTSSR